MTRGLIASNSAEGKAAAAKIKEWDSKKTAELQGKNKQAQDLQTKLQQGGNVLSESARSQSEKELQKLQRELQAMQAGAVTFLEKPCRPEQLWAGIELAIQQSSRQRKVKKKEQALRDRFTKLTTSERDVLARVIEGHHNKAIATELDLGLRTVELRRSNIMRKTGATSLSDT